MIELSDIEEVENNDNIQSFIYILKYKLIYFDIFTASKNDNIDS